LSDPITQIGAGGAFALLVIREVLNFLKTRNGKASGDKSPEFWRETFREIVENAIENHDSMRNEDIRRIIRDEVSRLR
jgi:hypothetical protein